MRFAHLAGRIRHDRIGQCGGIFRKALASGVQKIQRVVGGAFVAGHPERVQCPDRAEPVPRPGRHPVVLPFRVDDDDWPVGQQKIRQDGTDPLAGPGGGDGEQMARPRIAQQEVVWLCGAPDNQPVRPAEGIQFVCVSGTGPSHA